MMADGVAYAFPGWWPPPALELHNGSFLSLGPDKGRLSETSRHSPEADSIQELGVGATAPDPLYDTPYGPTSDHLVTAAAAAK